MPDDLLQPHYADSFRCIGPECEDSCCHGLGVYVDKATYKKYRRTPSLRESASQFIELNAERDNFKYAHIKFKPDNTCPFLDSGKLCSIQKQHGADFLSKTCSRYPRALARFDGGMQKALYLSCPEAARLVLLSPQLLSSAEDAPYDFTSANPQPLSRQLRRCALRFLQDRSYPLWQRLFVLGIICRRVQELVALQQTSQVPQLIAQYAEMMAQGRLRPHLDGIPARPELQLDAVLELIRRRFKIGQPEDGFAGCVADFVTGIRYCTTKPLQESAAVYRDADLRYYQPFAQAHPAFLENYVINYVFRTRFPFADVADCVERTIDAPSSHLLMVLHYRLLHSLLIGAAARFRDQFSAAHAVQVAQRFARAVEHNVTFLGELKALARGPDFLQSDGLAVLLAD